MGSLLQGIKEFMRGRFNLDEDNETQQEVKNRIEAGVVIRGTNLWVLIFATFIASIGLNVNSTAVIIGAMLVSPLMGPIMGIGMSLGINDFALLKRSLKNFGFMILISIMTSTLYFMISPLSYAQSELLARTQPTTWDVLIAFFGGLAGIVAQTRKDKTSTVIPGVAIATALMPPLCTSGFGLATGQWNYFAGAFYLFTINAVFIAMAALLIINFLKYDKQNLSDTVHGKKIKRIITAVILVTLVPSVFIGYNLVRTTVFEQSVKKFIDTAFVFEDSKVVSFKSYYSSNDKQPSQIDVVMLGKPVSQEAIDVLQSQMGNYGLYNTKLFVSQSGSDTNLSSSFIQTNFEELLKEKNGRISELENKVGGYEKNVLPAAEISKEMSALFSLPVDVSLARSVLYNHNGAAVDTVVLCYLQYESTSISAENRTKIVDWLKVRTNSKNVKLFFQH